MKRTTISTLIFVICSLSVCLHSSAQNISFHELTQFIKVHATITSIEHRLKITDQPLSLTEILQYQNKLLEAQRALFNIAQQPTQPLFENLQTHQRYLAYLHVTRK